MIPLCKLKSNRLRQLWLSQSDSHRWRYYHRQAFRNNYKCLLWFVKKAQVKLKVWLHIYIIAGPIKTGIIEKLGSILGPSGIFSKQITSVFRGFPKISRKWQSQIKGPVHIYIILAKWWYHYVSWNPTGSGSYGCHKVTPVTEEISIGEREIQI